MVILWANFDVFIQEEISMLLWLLTGGALRKSLRFHFLRTLQIQADLRCDDCCLGLFISLNKHARLLA